MMMDVLWSSIASVALTGVRASREIQAQNYGMTMRLSKSQDDDSIISKMVVFRIYALSKRGFWKAEPTFPNAFA
jgi:hypothetical protein